MARDKITVDLILQTKQAEREVARLNRKIAEVGKGLGKTFGGGGGGGDKVRALGTGLSKATVKADEFNKSLEASNARVIAFGASAGLIMGIERALKAIVTSAIKVEKAMLDINVVMNVSNKQLQQFGKGMFKVAKDTAQSFDTVSEAAVELARQGLGMERTLGRAKDALILTRLTGMNAADAVKSLTAAVNSFNKEGVTSAQIVNRMAKVDAAFAVSSEDLAKSISRVGASAVSAGVSMNELMAITTAVQQKTARGGAVIGNAFKTIFTRLQRKDVLQNLRSMGVAVTDFNGNALSGIQVLQNLANNFNNLSKATQASTAEQVAGVFQVNILKAAMSDLSSQTSNYGRALRTANEATDEAYQRNEQLNQSLDALINRTLANLTSAGAGLGGAMEPVIRNALGAVNAVIESFGKGGTFEDFGKTWGKGIISGLGSFIGGPGLVLVTAVFGKLALSLGRFAGKAIQDVLGINEASKQRLAIEEAVVTLIASEPTLLQKVKSGTMNILQVEEQILATVRLANLERARIQAYAGPVTGRLMAGGMTVGSKGATVGRAGGFVPNFADAGGERMAAAAGGYKAGAIRTMNQPGAGTMMYNTAETVKRFPGMAQSAIMPPQGSPAGAGYKAAFGASHGFDPYAGGGFVPNFMAYYQMGGRQVTGAGMASGLKSGKISPAAAAGAGYAKGQSKKTTGPKEHVYPASHLGVLGIEGAHSGNSSTTFGQLAQFKSLPVHLKKQKVTFAGMQIRTINAAKKNLTVQSFSDDISREMTTPVAKLSHKIFGKALGNDWASTARGLESKWGGKRQLLPPGAEGSIFEAAINLGLKATKGGAALNKTFDQGIGGSQKPFDFEETGKARPPFKTAFGFRPNLQLADAKRTINVENVRTIIKKAYNSKLKGLPVPAGLGYVPNFNPLTDAVGRELQGGVPASAIRIGSSTSLRSSGNPGGMGVYNTIHEPGGLGQGISRARSQGMNPKGHGVPNFLVKPAPMPSGYSSNVGGIPSGASGIPSGPPVVGASPASRLGLDKVEKGMSDAGKAAKDSAKASTEATKQTRRMGAAMGGMMFQMAAGAVAANMEEGVGQTAVKGVGGIAGYAGMGMMMGGPWGAAAGGAIGAMGMAFEMLTKHSQAAEYSFENLSKKLEEAQQTGAKVSETLGQLTTNLAKLDTERDPTKRYETGKAVARQLRQVAQDLPAGSAAQEKIKEMSTRLSTEGAFMSTQELLDISKDAEIENKKNIRSAGLDKLAYGTRQLQGRGDWWEGDMTTSQKGTEGNWGRWFEEGMTDFAAAYFGSSNFGMSGPTFPGTETAPANIRAKHRRMSAAENVPGYFKGLMGVKTISSGGKQTVAGALGSSEEAMAIIRKIREGSLMQTPLGSGMDLMTRSGADRGMPSGAFVMELQKAFAAAGLKDDLTANLGSTLNTVEARKAFINMMFGRGIEAPGSGVISTDVKGTPADPYAAFMSAAAEKEDKAIVAGLVKRPLTPITPRAPSGVASTRAFVESMRQASIAAKNQLSNTKQQIALDTKIRSIQDGYNTALAKATKDTIGVADAQLSQALNKAAKNFEEASTIAKETFTSGFKSDMFSIANEFKKESAKYDQGLFGTAASAYDPVTKQPIRDAFGGGRTRKAATFQQAQDAFEGLTQNYRGKGGLDALEAEIQRVQKLKREGGGSLGIRDEIIDKYGEKVREKLQTRTDELDQKMFQLGIAFDNTTTIATKEAEIKKEMLKIQRTLNTEKMAEVRLTKSILSAKRLADAKDREGRGMLSAKDYGGFYSKSLADDVAQRGVRKGDFSRAFRSGFVNEMGYNEVDALKNFEDGSRQVAQTMKTSFADAFKSITSGATDAKTAFANFATSILDTISNISSQMATDMMFNAMFGGNKKSGGGPIRRYNSGGLVTGGSGVRDDVPAVMKGGEFVIKQSSVDRLGVGFLNSVNSGGGRFAEGGQAQGPSMGAAFGVAAGAGAVSGLIQQANQPKPKKPWRGEDYGFGRGPHGYYGGPEAGAGKVDSISGGGTSARVSLGKRYGYYLEGWKSERSRPTQGRFEVSKALSLRGRLDENDRQTGRMFSREQSMGSYSDYLYAEEKRQREALKAHEDKKKGRRWSAVFNTAMMGIGDYYANKIPQGGPDVAGPDGMNYESFQGSGGEAYRSKMGDFPVQGKPNQFPRQMPMPPLPPRANPWSSKPMNNGGSMGGGTAALLTGGEYVMSPEAVRTWGGSFMSELNRGNVTGMANGGPVGGGGMVSMGNQGAIAGMLSGGETNNNVNISINIDKRGEAEAKVESTPKESDNTTKENTTSEVTNHRELGTALQAVVIQELIKQQRPGGLLQKGPHTP